MNIELGRKAVQKRRDTCEALISAIQLAEDQAMRLGMPISSRALNRAKNALGWEIAGNLEQAAKAALREPNI